MKELIKTFTFTNKDRPDIELSDDTKIRVNTEDGRNPILQLKSSDDAFPTDTNISAKTAIYNPDAIKRWTMFEVRGTFPENTSARYRMDNGSRELYWNTGTSVWETATATDWNTEAEISANFVNFPFDNTSIRVIVNLLTTDPSVTPTISEIKMLGKFEYSTYQDVVETLLQKMHDTLRPVTLAQSEVLVDTDTFDLSLTEEYKLENEGYNIDDVIAIYDLTLDPGRRGNILDVYTPGSLKDDGETFNPGIVTSRRVIAAGSLVEFQIKYIPEVADHTDEDFYEVAVVPSINLETMEEARRKDGLSVKSSDRVVDFIRDNINQTAVQLSSPAQIDLRFGYAIFSDLSLDQKRIIEEMEAFLENCKLLKSKALDCEWGLEIVLRTKTENKGTNANLMKAIGVFDIRGIALWVEDAISVPLTTQLNMDFTTQ